VLPEEIRSCLGRLHRSFTRTAAYLLPIVLVKSVSKSLTLIWPRDSQNPFPISSSEICPEPLSPQMISKIRGWIDECSEQHGRCVEYTINKVLLPRRLINLKGNCRLESAESPVRYAALSYCWGRLSNLRPRSQTLLCATTTCSTENFLKHFKMRYLWLECSDWTTSGLTAFV
jgi:hypothetical protein